MSTFSSILSQLQNNGSKTLSTVPPAKPVDHARAGHLKDNKADPHKVINAVSVSVKRRRDDDDEGPRKAPKTTLAARAPVEARKPPSPLDARKQSPHARKQAPQSYHSTMQAVKHTAGQQSAVRNAPLETVVSGASGSTAKPKRGFASLMAKAAAAQEASKAAGPGTIRHKTTDKLTRRDRVRLAQEAQPSTARPGKPQLGTLPANKAATFNGFKARTTPVKSIPKVVYRGTMRMDSNKGPKERAHKRGEGQDKYGGYASWSELDEAEDEQGSYDESDSDMEEAGYDEMMEEELKAARIARREDAEALREEERLKREKLERKKRLMAK